MSGITRYALAATLMLALIIPGFVGCVSPPRAAPVEDPWVALEASASATTARSRVALDTALNALGNAMAEVDAVRKPLVDDLYQGRYEEAEKTAVRLADAWDAEQEALLLARKTSRALATCTNAVGRIARYRLEAQAQDVVKARALLFRKAQRWDRDAREAAESATAAAEALKQQWLVPVSPPVQE